MNIRAALSYGADSPTLVEDVEIDEPRGGEILVRMVASGVCHTDLVVKKTWPMNNAERLPVVLGHEGAGVVEAVGPSVSKVKPGDHVLLSYASCRQCKQCEAGRPYYCTQFGLLNMGGGRVEGPPQMTKDGKQVFGGFFGQSSFASYALSSESNTVVVDPELDLRVVAPFGCGTQTGAGAVLNTINTQPGDSLAVFGCGGVGLAAVMAAKAVGAKVIVAVDPVAERREVALDVGATHVIDPLSEDVVPKIQELTGGGANGSIETSARADVVKQALQCLAPMGTCVNLGVGTPEFPFTMQMVGGGRRLTSIIEGEADPQEFLPRLIELYRNGQMPIDRLIKYYQFDDFEQAVHDSETGATIKPVLLFE